MSQVRNYQNLHEKGLIRVDDSDGVQFGKKSNYNYVVLDSVLDKKPYETMTGRQQFYIDHEWFLQEGEALPTYRAPASIDGYGLRLTMGHARHGIHSMFRDETLLMSLQRGEPDVFVNPDDAAERGVADGDMIRVRNNFGSFVVHGARQFGHATENVIHVSRLGPDAVRGVGELQLRHSDSRPDQADVHRERIRADTLCDARQGAEPDLSRLHGRI